MLQHAATFCNMLQHAITCCNMLQHAATCCNMLQHAATCCSMLQHAATDTWQISIKAFICRPWASAASCIDNTWIGLDVRRYKFLPGSWICFVLNSTNTPGQKASSDVHRYAFLPCRICLATELFLFLRCWQEAPLINYQKSFMGCPFPLSFTMTSLSVGT